MGPMDLEAQMVGDGQKIKKVCFKEGSVITFTSSRAFQWLIE